MKGQLQAFLLICLLSSLSACAAVPGLGDIQRFAEFRESLRKLIDTGVVNAHASRVTLDMQEVSGWQARSFAITTAVYQKQLKEFGGFPSDSFGNRCESNLGAPVFYLLFDPRVRALIREKNRITLGDGSCTQLQRNKIDITIGFYNFREPFSIQVPASERTGRLEKALEQFTLSSHRQTDNLTWESRDLLVGEAAGYLYHDITGLIPHSTLYEKKDNNYYRLVLVGDRVIVTVDVYGTTSMSVDELQSAVWPVAQALRFENASVGR